MQNKTNPKKSDEELQKVYDELEQAKNKIQIEKRKFKKLKDKTLKYEKRFRDIFENSLIGIYRTTPSGKIIMSNSALIEMLGHSSFEELSKRNLEKEKWYHPQYPRSEFKKRLERDGRVIGLESAWTRKDGSALFIRENATSVYDDNNNILYYEGTIEDITDRIKAETAWRESNLRYKNLFEDSPISLWEEDFSKVKKYISNLEAAGVKDFKKYFKNHPEEVVKCVSLVKVLDVNKATLRIYDSKTKGILLSNLNKVFFKDSYDTFRRGINSLIEGKLFFEEEAITQTLKGRKNNIRIIWRIVPGYEETWSKLIISIDDITERKKDEQKIKTTKDYLQNVIDSASEIIFTIGSDFKIKTWNKSARMITGYKQSHIVGKSINNLTLFENQSEINDYIKTVLNGKTASLEELTINTSFGIKKQFSVSPSFIGDESKNVNEILFVCRDITYEKERHGKLQFGRSYLISESTSEAAVEIFTGMLRTGHSGLYIGRTSDSEIKNIFTDVTPTIVKLSKEKDKKHLTCSNFEELLRTIKDYVSKEKQSIVLLDRIEYLIINSSFESVIKNIYLLNDMIGKHNCLLLLRISPSLLDKTQMVILKEELQQLPERQIDDVQLEETLFEILDYIQIENRRNALVSYSRIGKQFSISKVTTQRRIESLIEKGLIFSKKQGRIKILYIKDKGKNLLVQRTLI